MMGNKIVLNLPLEDVDFGKLKKWLGRACWVPSCRSCDSFFHIWFPKLSSHQAFLNCEKIDKIEYADDCLRPCMHGCVLCVCVCACPKQFHVTLQFRESERWYYSLRYLLELLGQRDSMLWLCRVKVSHCD